MPKTILNIALFFLTITGFSQNEEIINKSNSEITDDDIWAISVDNDGTKWLGTSKFGLIKYDNQNFINLNKENSEINGDFVSPIFTDSKGNVWLSFSKPDKRLAKFDGSKWTVFSENEIPNSSISVIAITEDKEGNVFFGGGNGVIKYDGENWTKLDLPKEGITVRAMDINKDGEIAVGHNSGLLIRKQGEWKSYSDKNSKLQLSVVRAVKYIDDKLYIGYGGGRGNGGFSIVKGKKWKHFNKTNSKVPDHMVRVIKVGANGTIWMATNDGLIKISDGVIKPIFFRDGAYTNVIMDIAIENDKVWIATNFGLIKIE